MGKYNLAAVKVSRNALDEYGWLRQNGIFETIQEISKTVMILLLNVRLFKHAFDIATNCSFMHNDILYFVCKTMN